MLCITSVVPIEKYVCRYDVHQIQIFYKICLLFTFIEITKDLEWRMPQQRPIRVDHVEAAGLEAILGVLGTRPQCANLGKLLQLLHSVFQGILFGLEVLVAGPEVPDLR